MWTQRRARPIGRNRTGIEQDACGPWRGTLRGTVGVALDADGASEKNVPTPGH